MPSRRKQPKDLDSRLDAIRSDIDQLKDDSKGLAADATDIAGNRARDAIRAAAAVAERALRLAEDTASGMKDDVEAWTNDNLDMARDHVRKQPLSAIGVALGIGVILGALFLRL
jgi:ElaB/YqjD/DUF883 family membrane-anchored ribosome-binding protein